MNTENLIESDGIYYVESQVQLAESTVPTPTKIDLRDAHAVRREMAAVYRDMRAGRIQTQDGTRLAYVLDMVRKAHETAELEARITTLEEKNAKTN